MITPENLAKANYLKLLREWHWEGEQGFVQLVQDHQSPGMVVVEIGCYDGSTTRKYIDIVKKNNGHVIVIDTFMGTVQTEETAKFLGKPPKGAHAYGLHNTGLHQMFLDKFAKYSDMMTVIKGFSHDCIPNLPENCDFIFIDADHIYKSIYNDIKLSLPKVKKGGILCGHDCENFNYVNKFPEEALNIDYWNHMHAGVIQAVYDHFGITKLYGLVWYVEKN